jgi:hypothetical protein
MADPFSAPKGSPQREEVAIKRRLERQETEEAVDAVSKLRDLDSIDGNGRGTAEDALPPSDIKIFLSALRLDIERSAEAGMGDYSHLLEELLNNPLKLAAAAKAWKKDQAARGAPEVRPESQFEFAMPAKKKVR